jgi:hypothetical protein
MLPFYRRESNSQLNLQVATHNETRNLTSESGKNGINDTYRSKANESLAQGTLAFCAIDAGRLARAHWQGHDGGAALTESQKAVL